jgi:hypothetical protein
MLEARSCDRDARRSGGFGVLRRSTDWGLTIFEAGADEAAVGETAVGTEFVRVRSISCANRRERKTGTE